MAFRKDLLLISSWIKPNTKVLDLGCGNGELLKILKQDKNISGYGIDNDIKNIKLSLRNNVNILQMDLDKGLNGFELESFDYVVLSQTLQAFLNPEVVINELLRVGKKAIVTIPNFGYWKVRLHLLTKGTMPITKTLPDEWYNTPNLHMCTIKDFVYFVKSRNFKIFKSLALNGHNVSLINDTNLGIKNLFADLGIFLIEK